MEVELPKRVDMLELGELVEVAVLETVTNQPLVDLEFALYTGYEEVSFNALCYS